MRPRCSSSRAHRAVRCGTSSGSPHGDPERRQSRRAYDLVYRGRPRCWCVGWRGTIPSPTGTSGRLGRRWSCSSTSTTAPGNPSHPTPARPKKPCWRSRPEGSTRPGPQHGSKNAFGSSAKAEQELDKPTSSVCKMAPNLAPKAGKQAELWHPHGLPAGVV